MSLRRSLEACCDREGCTRSVELNPNSIQPFLDLLNKGWAINHDDATSEQLLACDLHKDS